MLPCRVAAKQTIVHLLRGAGLIGSVDRARMYLEVARTRGRREAFRRSNPSFPMPPPPLAYDAFGSLDPDAYLELGTLHARFIAGIIRRFQPAASAVCDWGCGPVRVLRHMPEHFPPGTRFLGLDMNPDTISWCSANFPGIEFRRNALAPPLPLETGSVDVLYCMSVFTHLSEELHHSYVRDIHRVLKPEGLLIATTHGDRYRGKLLSHEAIQYDAGELVCRSNVEEGKRMFVAFHSPKFMREKLFRDFNVLEHDSASTVPGFSQDVWIASSRS